MIRLDKSIILSQFPMAPVNRTTATMVSPPLVAIFNVRCPASMYCDWPRKMRSVSICTFLPAKQVRVPADGRRRRGPCPTAHLADCTSASNSSVYLLLHKCRKYESEDTGPKLDISSSPQASWNLPDTRGRSIRVPPTVAEYLPV